MDEKYLVKLVEVSNEIDVVVHDEDTLWLLLETMLRGNKSIKCVVEHVVPLSELDEAFNGKGEARK